MPKQPFKPLLPTLLTAAVVAGALALMVLMGHEIRVLGEVLDHMAGNQYRQLSLANEIIRYDESLTSATHLAVNTGDPRWEQYYDEELAKLMNALSEAARLSEGIGHKAVDQIDLANKRLVAMEHKAFRLAALGLIDEAQAVLNSEQYATEKTRYSQGIDALYQLLRSTTESEFQEARERSETAWQFAVFAIFGLFIATIVLALVLTRTLINLRASEMRQAETRRQLKGMVDETITKLEHSKTALEREVETRKVAETKISVSEARYRSMVEASHAGFFILDEAMRLRDANQRYIDLTGRKTLGDIKDRSVIEWIAGYHREQYLQAIDKAYDTGVLENLEIDYVNEVGTPTPVEINGTLVKEDDSFQFYGLCLDITDRREAQRAMQESETKYHRLIEITETAFVVVDHHGLVLDANQQYVELTGHERMKDVLGRSVVEWTAEHDREKNAAAVVKCYQDGMIRNFQVDYVTPNGRIVPVEVNASVMEGPGGKEIHALCRDITARRRAENRLRESEERLSMAFRSGHVGFWDWDVASGAVHYNDEWANLIGYTLDEITPTYYFWEKHIHPDDKQASVQAVEDHLAGRTRDFEIEHRLRHKDGHWVWVLGVGQINRRDEDGTPLRMTGVMIDVTRRKQAEVDLAVSEERFRNVALTSGDWIWQIDKDFKFVYASDSIARILGYTPAEIIGKSPFDLMPEDEAMRIEALIEDTVHRHEPLEDLENWNLTKDGERACMLTTGVPVFDANGDFAGYFGTDKNITERKRNEYQLKLFGRVFESALEGITITDAEGTIIAVNQAFTAITGYSEEEALGQNPRILRSDKHEDEFYTEMWNRLTTDGKWEGEIWNRRKDGDAFPEWLSISAIRDEDGHTSHYVAVFHDITETKRKEEQIQYQAYHDALTGLPNRLLLQDRLILSIRRARRAESQTALLFIDLDNFKSINDSMGHAMGDLLLLEVAERFQSVVRDSDTVARLGGDEFVVLMDEIQEEEDAVLLARRLIEVMEAPFRINDRDLFTTPSIGIAIYPRDGEDAELLLKNADIAMYRAKDMGRNQFNLFTTTLNDEVQRRLTLERDMRRALEEKEFFLLYQPKVNVLTGRTEGMEALVRWDRNGEVISPMEFIPIAERTGLIHQLGNEILNMALAECADLLREHKTLRVSVNLSPRQFLQADLVDQLETSLTLHQVKPQWLDVEITESTLLTDIDDTIRKLECISRMGVTVSVDDFGTGYSSLSYVKRLPVDTLKVDRSFIVGLGTDQGDESILKTIIQLARNFGMQVVAEGVETEDQLYLLRSFECDVVQGYLYSKPVPLDEFKTFLESTGV